MQKMVVSLEQMQFAIFYDTVRASADEIWRGTCSGGRETVNVCSGYTAYSVYSTPQN
jgi:hypothetical protein